MRASVSGAAVLLAVAVAGVAGAFALTAPAHAQAAGALIPGDTVWATPRQRYEAGGIHRFVLGNGYRDLWSTPVRAVVLDLDGFAGGLELVGEGGGLQTRSLRFVGGDGRTYSFRSLDKDASRTLDPELRESVAARILQDQVSSLLPLSAMVVAPLLQTAGVLHAVPTLAVMPPDPRLGLYLDEFGGLLGWIEERPDEPEDGGAGFAGSYRIVGSDRLLELIEDEPSHRVNAASYLRARLMDVLVGDWDRHPGQWRWARYDTPAGRVYEPIPRDRDWALARMDGAITWFAQFPWPHYLGFAADMESAFRHTWSGRALDRLILPRLDWSEWDRIATDVQSRVTDAAIHEAVARLPDPYEAVIGAELEASLRSRRDALRAFAREFHDLVLGWAEVHATDRPEVAQVRRLPGDTVLLEIWEVDDLGPKPVPYVRRSFTPDVTREVRVFLHGGDDVVSVNGTRSGAIRIRVVGGGGNDTFVDETGGGRTHFYDARGENRFRTAPRTEVEEHPWVDPIDPTENTHQAGSRDWGARTLPVVEMEYLPDRGLSFGAGASRTRYGFRRWPYAARFDGVVGFSAETRRGYGRLEADLPVGRTSRLTAGVALDGDEVRRFYGFGNETEELLDDDFYEALRREISVEARLHVLLGGATASVGAKLRSLRDLGGEPTLVDSLAPYGFPDFDQIGLGVALSWEGGVRHPVVGSPAAFEIDATWMPPALDVEEAFGVLAAQASVSFGLSDDAHIPPVMAVRAGVRHVFGEAPYHESSFLGGADDLRGFRNQRFAGDDEVFVSGELRLGLGRAFLLLPWDIGLLALVDAGRVFVDGEDSRRWHRAAGGGLWFSFLGRYTATLTVAHGEITALYARMGFEF